jgi:CRISPR-associated endonuclease/helicase Cas3
MLAQIKNAGFNYLFLDYTLKGIQTLLDNMPLTQRFTLVESDTGLGKTEFALSLCINVN